jgi:hypothetical protein
MRVVACGCTAARTIELRIWMPPAVYRESDAGGVVQCDKITESLFNLFTRAGQASRIQPSGQLADIRCKPSWQTFSPYRQIWGAYVLVLVSPVQRDQLAVWGELKAQMDTSLLLFVDQGKILHTSLFWLATAMNSPTDFLYSDYHIWYCPVAWTPGNPGRETPRQDLCAPPGERMSQSCVVRVQHQATPACRPFHTLTPDTMCPPLACRHCVQQQPVHCKQQRQWRCVLFAVPCPA